MKNIRWTFIVLSVLTFIGIGLYYIFMANSPQYVEEGVLDFQTLGWPEKGYMELNGEWEFYFNEFIEPGDFEGKEPRYIKVPGIWNRDVRGEKYPVKGFGTYRLVLKNFPTDEVIALKKTSIRNASRIFINGELKTEDGLVSESLEGSDPGNKPQLIFLRIPDGEAEIVIHVSNHEFIQSGIARPILLGEQDVLMHRHESMLLFEFSMTTISVLIGLLYLILYLSSRYYRKEEPTVLSLSLSTIFLGLMATMYGERILGIFFSTLGLDGIFRIGHALAACAILWMLSLFHQLYEDFLPRTHKNILSVVFGFMFIFILFFPLHIYMYALQFYFYFSTLVFFVLWIRVLWWLSKKSTDKAHNIEHILYAMAIFCAFIFYFDEMLFSLGNTDTMHLSFLAIGMYSVAMASLLLYRYTLHYRRSRELSMELLQTLDELGRQHNMVEEKEMSFLQAQIKPHFLFNTLNVISSQILVDPEKAHELVSSLGEYLHAKFDFENTHKWIHLEEELSMVGSYLELEQSRFEERLKVVWDVEDHLHFLLPPFTLQPLVENAIRHGLMETMEGGTVKISVYQKEENYIISVADDGIGMPDEIIRSVLKENGLSRGVGLINVHRRLKLLYREGLFIESGLDEGTIVYYKIPVEDVRSNEIRTD
jgi:two-component system LytT family sensor kinase